MQSYPGRSLRSRCISGVHSFTDFTARAMLRLSLSPRQGITVYSTVSSLSILTTDHNQGGL